MVPLQEETLAQSAFVKNIWRGLEIRNTPLFRSKPGESANFREF